MKLDDAGPTHGIFEFKIIGSAKTFPATKEIARSRVSPLSVVNDFQLALTSVLTFNSNSLTPAGNGTDPAQLTETISITRSSTAYAGANPRVARPKSAAVTKANLFMQSSPWPHNKLSRAVLYTSVPLDAPRSIFMAVNRPDLVTR